MNRRIVVLEVLRPVEGGIKRHILDLVHNLDQETFEVHVACAKDLRFEEDLAGCVAGIWPLTFSTRLFSPSDILPAFSLVGLMRRIRPDIVHLHGFKPGVTGRLAALFVSRPRVVYTLHNSILGSGRGRLSRGIAAMLERALALRTEEVIAVSRSLAREYLDSVNFPEGRVTCIHNGVDPKAFNVRSAEVAGTICGTGETLIGTCARLIPSKGLRFFIEAAPRVLERFPQTRFMVIGDGPERGYLETLAARLRVERAFQFMGYRSDARHLVGRLSLFVLPTLSEGGMPIAILEAMAQGVPVVATCVGGVPDAVEDGVTGRLVRAGSAAELSRAICDLLENPDRARSMAEAARRLVLREFTVERMVAATESIYKRVVQLGT